MVFFAVGLISLRKTRLKLPIGPGRVFPFAPFVIFRYDPSLYIKKVFGFMFSPFFARFLANFALCGFLLVLMGGGAFAAETLDPARAAGLVPHKALYDIKLVGTRSGSQIVNISGQMLYEWQPACEAWVSKHRFDLSYEYADSPAMRITSDFSTYEDFDGAALNFASQRKREGQVFEKLRGLATLDEQKGGVAEFSLPEDLEYEIPEGGVFPMGHTLGLLKSMAAGDKFYNATIFDGSDDKGPVNINAFLGQELQDPPEVEESEDIDQALLSLPARQIQLAFFPLEDEVAMADYEMDLVFHHNGVISSMLVKYADFSVFQTLKALEGLEAKSCDSN